MSINNEQLDQYMRASHAKRFVVENSITKVTSDGEPHEMMTMIAGLSGFFAAMVILGVLIALVSCKGGKRNKHCKNCPLTTNGNDGVLRTCNLDRNSTHSTISASKAVSIEDGNTTPPTSKDKTNIAIISSGNLSGNLNSAFIDSELNLTDTLSKPKKKTHFIDEVDTKVHIKETVVDIERL